MNIVGEYECYRQDLWNSNKSEEDDASTSEIVDHGMINNQDDGVGSSCRVFVVASAIGTPTKPKPYLFRNYNYGEIHSRHPGTSNVPLWSALRATTSAPGYFKEHRIGMEIFGDGAIVANNPTGIAIHEAACLFPNRPIACVVSLGTGRFNTDVGVGGAGSSDGGSSSVVLPASRGLVSNVMGAMSRVVDTEVVHHVVSDLLEPRKECTYVRINPKITPVALNENKLEILKNLQQEFCTHLEKAEVGVKMLNRAERGLSEREEKWSVRGVTTTLTMMGRASRL